MGDGGAAPSNRR